MVTETRPMTDIAREGSIATELSRLLADSYAHETALWMLRSTAEDR